ncbi:MAG: protein phosphatase domain protein [Polaromonas sp.]|nr:protein phosphatase domain protein [Polaromonas sp.]
MNNSYRITASTGTHKGDREYQQDQVSLLSHHRIPECMLGIVADGMGGRSGGRKASDQVMLTAKQLFDRFSPDTDDAPSMLRQIVEEAHTVIKLTAISSEEEPHSTLAAFLITPGGECHWVHTGDSRIYHFHGSKLVYKTSDHSYVQSLVDSGEISEEEANNHPQSNILMGCLGADEPPPIAQHYISKLRPNDVLMGCSDGVWHYFNSSEMGSALSMLSPREASEFLIQKACKRARGVGDNLSLVIVKFEALD